MECRLYLALSSQWLARCSGRYRAWMAEVSGRPSPETFPVAAVVASQRYFADVPQATSRTLSAWYRHVSLPLEPGVVETPAFRSPSVTTWTTELVREAESSLARV